MASNPLNSTNSSQIQPHGDFCTSPFTKQTLTAWFVVYLLCFPVFLSALYTFFKKMRNSVHLSHSDIFTSQILVMEIVNTAGTCVIFHGVYVNVRDTLVSLAVCMSMLTRFGQMSFHCLTCVERYLAVVHPIMYLRLKTGGGVIVKTCIVFSWLYSAGLGALVYKKSLYFYHFISSLLSVVFSSAIVSFCTVSTLCVLIRPGPGEGGRDRKTINQSKRAALSTMAFILGAELLSIVNSILVYVVALLSITTVDMCLLSINSLWFQLPNSVVLPLLFLYRARKKKYVKKKTKKHQIVNRNHN